MRRQALCYSSRAVRPPSASSGRYVYSTNSTRVGPTVRSPTNVGEIRRVLNSFLQILEKDGSDSLIVAATNHPGLLDHALFRRVLK